MIQKIINNRISIIFIIPFFLGLLSVFSFQPFNVTIINFITLPLLFFILVYINKRSKNVYRKKPYLTNLFLAGYCFGFGFFLSGNYWIAYSLTYEDSFKYLIPFAIILIPAFLGLFFGFASLAIGPFLKKNFYSILIFSVGFSLSDFISFGVAPALILYFWTTQNIHGVGWASVLFFSTCMALRLARFNTKLDDPDPPSFAARFFLGIPAPAAAGLACLPVILSFEIDQGVIRQPYVIAGWLVLVGLMMVSSIPTFSFKGTKLPQKLVIPIFVVAGLFIACALTETWIALAALIIIYILTIPLSYRSYRRLSLLSKKTALIDD